MKLKLKDNQLLDADGRDLLVNFRAAVNHLMEQKDVRRLSLQEFQDLKFTLNKIISEASRVHLNDDTNTDRCTGYMWRDEFGNEAFAHYEYIYCPVHDR